MRFTDYQGSIQHTLISKVIMMTPTPYRSFGSIMVNKQSPYLHLWYSFSKDFGISGFRVGMVHSYNEDFLKAYGNINLTHSVSNLTQWVLQSILEDQDFTEKYIARNQQLLTDSYAVVATSLRKMGIPYNHPEAAYLPGWTYHLH